MVARNIKARVVFQSRVDTLALKKSLLLPNPMAVFMPVAMAMEINMMPYAKTGKSDRGKKTLPAPCRLVVAHKQSMQVWVGKVTA